MFVSKPNLKGLILIKHVFVYLDTVQVVIVIKLLEL